jgi:cysteine desulfurase
VERIYLDYNSTTPVDDAVIDAMRDVMNDNYGNPSSVHSFGQRAKAALDQARASVAAAIGAEPAEIYFTSGGTEADNLALKGAAQAVLKKGNHVIVSSIEHHAILESGHFMQKNGYEVTFLACGKDGRIAVDSLRDALKPTTTVVSVMMANNETGMIQPVADMAALCREKGVLFHTDAVQAVGKIPVNVKDLGIDMLSLSAHKFYGPKGVGALYVKQGVRVTPLLHGGSHEKRRRAGTENLPGIVGLAKALEIALARREHAQARMTELSSYFIQNVQSRIEHVYLNGSLTNRIPSTVNLSFQGVEGESIILSLDLKGIAVSSGSACTSGALEASHVLMAMGIDPLLAQGSIRFSLGRQTTKEQLDYTVSVLPDIISRLRAMSASYRP